MGTLEELHIRLLEKGYKNQLGELLGMDKDFKALLELTEVSYMTGIINGAKKFGYWRGGKMVLGQFEIPLSDFVKETEKKFGRKYKSYSQRHGPTGESSS
jgi:hypothetical protein